MSDAKFPPIGDDVSPKVLEELQRVFGLQVPAVAAEELVVAEQVPASEPDDAQPDEDATPVESTPPGLRLDTPAVIPEPNVPEPDGPELAGPQPAGPEPAAADPLPAAPTEPSAVVTPIAAAKTRVRIGGSDLPDAVYLDEEGEGRLRGTSVRSTEQSVHAERITILIDSDDAEGQSGGIPVSSGPATMDPRVRARRIAVKRAIGRRRLRWLYIGGAVVVVLVAALALLGSSLFAIDNVTVSGAGRIDPILLGEVIDDLDGTPALLVDTGEVESRLEADPWVSNARVSTRFPHSASVEIVERRPIATYAGSDGQFRIVDGDGFVVAIEANRPIEFMLLTGSGADVRAGDSAGRGITYAAQLVEALSAAVRTRTRAIVVSQTDEITILFHTGTTVILGGPTDLLEKLTRLEAVLLRPDADQYTLINVSTAEISTK